MARPAKGTTTKKKPVAQVPKSSVPPSKPPPRKRKPTAKAKAADESEGSEIEEETTDTTLPINWKPVALSQKLIAHIMENANIKRSLFPPPGPNPSTKKGGGTPKNVAQFQLCKLLLAGDSRYTEALAHAEKDAKERSNWSTKITNRLRTMSTITRDFMEEMGETGAGINSAEEIDMGVTNAFTNKWAQISSTCPWFFDMRNLIAQRPNVIPTGVGNSATAMDAALILPPPALPAAPNNAEDVEDTPSETSVPIDGWNPTPSPRQSPGPDVKTVGRKRFIEEVDDGAGSGDDYEPSSPGASESVGIDVVADEAEEQAKDVDEAPKPEKKSRPAKASTSTPAAPVQAVASKPSKKSKVTEFSEIAKSEEKSRQKDIELATLRTRHAIKTTEVKGRLAEKREERKREERMMKYKMKEEKERRKHELRMARIRFTAASNSQATNFLDGLSTSDSHYTSSEPGTDFTDFTDYGNLDTFAGNAMAGPSTSSPATAVDFDLGDVQSFDTNIDA
ncbi:hypothetical protein C8R45DRAFT_1103433 [Mycena sanguinolenta]|nr:hypothetical protein C8R45DRAFT_1103433 [Mycena sanguinolenta]